jgi:hypothetical protein
LRSETNEKWKSEHQLYFWENSWQNIVLDLWPSGLLIFHLWIRETFCPWITGGLPRRGRGCLYNIGHGGASPINQLALEREERAELGEPDSWLVVGWGVASFLVSCK